MNINERQTQIIKEFTGLTNWEERYKKVIEMGKSLPSLSDEHKIEKNKVQGCQSQVWLVAKANDKGLIEFSADGDAIIAKGLIALLLKVYSESTSSEIIETEPLFIEELGFKNNLSPSRANGLFSMIKQIKYYAAAFKMLGK